MKRKEFWNRVLEQIRTLVGVERAVILVDAGASIRAIASDGFVNPIDEVVTLHARDGVFATAMATRRAVQSDDVLNDAAIPLSPVSPASIEAEGYRAALAVPLLADGRVLGAIVMCRTRAGRFSAGDVETAESLADLVARAVEHDQVGDVEVARVRRDEALIEVEREVLAELSTERLFPLILERAGQLVDGTGTVYVVEPGQRSLRRAWTTSSHGLPRLPFGEGISGVCAERCRGVLVEDYARWAPAHTTSYVPLGVQTAMSQPLLSRGELLGVITMSRPVPSRPFQPKDLDILLRFASQAALALRNATLFGEAEHQRQAAQELARLARTLSDRLNLSELGDEIVRSFGTVFPDRSCTLRLIRPDGLLEVVASSHDFEPGHTMAPHIGLTARALAQQRAVGVPDLLAEPGLVYDDDVRRRVIHQGVRAALVIPLRTERGVIGTLQVSMREVHEFSTHEMELSQAYADQVAVTLERARLFEALRKSDARYRDFFDNSNEPMAVGALDGSFTTVNRAMEQLLGYSREELAGRHFSSVTTPDTVAAGEERLRRSLAGERLPRIWELAFQHKNGKRIPLECTTRFLHDPSGKVIGWEGVFRDVTAHKEMETALRQAKEAAESASRAKSSFLATMSHELRTPLNAILGYVQVLKHGDAVGAKRDNAVGIIEQSGEALLDLINEILDIARIEAGSFAVQASAFHLTRLLDGIVATMRARAEEKRLSFFAEWSSELPRVVRSDERRLRQVLVNLLDNAIKYTQEGGVAFKVGHLDGRIRFLVEDTGIGIDPQHVAGIFEAFHQVRDPKAFIEGSGLGLAISKTLVDLLGGRLEVTSTPSEGSRFWFDLELPEVSGADLDVTNPRRTVVDVRGDRRRLLVVDDKEDNRRLLRDLLAPLAFHIGEAANGPECLARLDAERPDAILLDLRMPGMDGLEVARRIRAAERGPRVVIIAISASAFEHHRQQCLDAGADDFIAKPFRLATMLDLLCRHLGLELVCDATPEDRPPRSVADADARAIAPAADDLTDLLELARRGSVRRILAHVATLETDGRYPAFTAEVRRLAERFDVRQLCQFLQEIRA